MSTTRYCQAGHRFDIDGTMAVGETITVTVTPAQDYQFVSWSDGNTDNPRQINITECGITYTARFTSTGPGPTPPTPTKKHTITLKASPSNGGTVTGGGQYDDGASVTIRATANSGYTFTSWTNGSQVVTTNPTYTFTATSNASFTANFTSIAPTLSYKWISSGQTASDASALSNLNNYQIGTSQTVNLNNRLYCHVGFIIPENATISGSYKDALQQTINLSFSRLPSPPVTVDSGFKYMYAATGGFAPSGYTDAIITINL